MSTSGRVTDRGPAQAEDPHAELEIRPRPRRLEWAGYGVVVVLLAMFVNNLITNDRWNWPIVREFLFSDQVLEGLANTIKLTLLSGVTGTLFGLVIAMMRLSRSPLLRGLATTYVAGMRAIPALVLLLIIYFLGAILPRVSLGIPFGPDFAEVPVNSLITQFVAAWVGLTMIMGAHCGEIFRGGVMSVAPGQLEAAKALGMPPFAAFRRIVLPQAIRVTIPALANELISLFKNTSLVSIIGYAELLTVVQLIYGRTYQTIPMLLVACIWYLALITVSMLGQRQLEKRFGRGFVLGANN